MGGQGDAKEPPNLSPQDTLRIPYAKGEPVLYRWFFRGKRCAETSFTLTPSPSGAKETQLDATLRYSRDGRQIHMTGKTILGPRLNPRRYEGSKGLLATGAGLSRTSVSAHFEADTAHVTLNTTVQTAKEFGLRNPTYIYESQAIEHWASLATVLAHSGPGVYSLFMPTDMRILEFKFKKERQLQNDSGRQWRWSGFHPSMQVRLWITEEGVLIRYQQGDLNIQLVRENKDVKR